MIKLVEKEVKKLIKNLELNCSVEEFKDKVDWTDISANQKLSEKFIREFEDKVCWHAISSNQKLSEKFIREFEDEVYWTYISRYQKLSEKFIREFKDKVDWTYISKYQKLSEKFIREFKDRVDRDLYKEVNRELTLKQKLEEAKQYAKKHNLKIDKNYLYAFREHDFNGRGVFNKTLTYKKEKYYKDWHLDMRKEVENSFGLGIWPKGNTPVKVKIADWGVEVNRGDGKARVWGFEIV